MKDSVFEKLVKESLLALPENIREKMENVAIVIEDRPSEDDLKQTGIRYGNFLLGLYQGTPKTAWGRGYGMRLPDKITIFQEPIENLAHSRQGRGSPEAAEEEIVEIVKNTVWHEVAHHFGFNEKQIRGLEAKRKK